MSVIIRLQGLPWTASAMNIRHFFTGLNIPAGGVHIIGGEGGDAFIAFSSDEDARVAMKMNMSPLNGAPVQLYLSSKSEMQSVIDAARSGPGVPGAAAPSQNMAAMANNMPGMNQMGNAGMNSMGTGNTAMANQPGGFAGMQGQIQNQMMQQPPNQMNPQVGGNMNNGMGVRNEWQGYPGMGAMGDTGQNQNVNVPQFQQNQNMLGGGQQQQNDQFSRFQNMRQQNPDDPFTSAPPQRDMMMGRPVPGQDIAAEGKMEVAPQPVSTFARKSRFDNPDARPSPSRGGMAEKSGQFPAVDGVMQQEVTPDQRAGSLGKDETTAMTAGQMGRMPDTSRFSADRFGGNQMPMEKHGSGMVNKGPWGAEKQMEDDYPDNSRFYPDPSRQQMFRQDMGREEFRRGPDERKWPNRFEERPEDSDQQGAFGMGMNRNENDPGYPERDARMQDQYRDRFRNRQDMPGRFSERAPGRLESDRGNPPVSEDGLPSTRYPPDDEAPPPMAEGAGRGLPGERRSLSNDRRMMPGDRRFLPEDHRGEDQRGVPDFRRGFPEDERPDDRRPPSENRLENQRGTKEERRFRPRVSRFDRDEMGAPIEQDGRFPPNPNERRFPPDDRFGDDMAREFPRDDRLPPGRPFPDDDGRRGADDRKFPPGEGRPMPDDRMGMWPGDRYRPDDMMGRRPGDNPFAPEDPRHREKEEELHREAFERGPGGLDERFMHAARGRGGMRGMGRPGADNFGMRPFPPDRRGGIPPERPGGIRDMELDYPQESDRYPEGPDRWGSRFDRKAEPNRPERDQRPGLLEAPDVAGGIPPERGHLLDNPDPSVPLDMDQRFDREGPGRRPDMFRDDDYGRGPPMEEGFGRDLDSRTGGPRGRGGSMMDRGPRGRGDPFGRGRPGGMPPFGRGRGNEPDRFFEEPGAMGQDVDNRNREERFPNVPEPHGVPERPPPGHGGRGLLGDAPKPPVAKSDEPKVETEKEDVDSRPPRRSDDRDRDRRHNDDRRGRDRDDRDRTSYRGRYDRDRERDRSRRRSRSRSRDRGSRDKDSRYGRDNRERSSRDKSSVKSDNDSSKVDGTKNQRPTRFLTLKNMPNTANFRDVRRLLHPMEIPFDGIKMINDKDGNRTGEAFVYFHRLDDAVRAQRKNGERMEGRPLSIQFTTEDEFNKAVDSFVPQRDPAAASASTATSPAAAKGQGKMRFVVQMKNMPPTITRQDISSFFKDLKIEQNGEAAYIEFDQNGVATGVGYVEFKSDNDYKKALTQDGTMLDANKVRVIPGKAEDADKMKAVQGEMFQRAALRSIANKVGANSGPRPPQQQPMQTPQFPKSLVPPVDNGDLDNVCVHIQGLPLLATHQDIRDFFSDCLIAPRGINIAHDGAGKPLGEGFVEFRFKSEVDKALKKDKTSLGRHIVAVKPISKKYMVDRLDGAKNRGNSLPKPPTSVPSSSSPSPSPMGPSFGNSLLSKTPTTQENPMQNKQHVPYPQQMPPLPQQQQQHLPPLPQQQVPLPPTQPPQIPLPPPQQQQQQQQQIPGGPPDPSDSQGAPPNPGNQQRPPPQQNMNKGPMALLQTPPQGMPLVVAPGGGKSFPPGVLNNNWFYVRCQNFPPDITIAEIMQFFHTFRAIGESIRLHYSSEGHPTGNAVVGFQTAEEANRAIQRLNMRPCRQNQVGLHPA